MNTQLLLATSIYNAFTVMLAALTSVLLAIVFHMEAQYSLKAYWFNLYRYTRAVSACFWFVTIAIFLHPFVRLPDDLSLQVTGFAAMLVLFALLLLVAVQQRRGARFATSSFKVLAPIFVVLVLCFCAFYLVLCNFFPQLLLPFMLP